MPRASWRGFLRLSLVSCPIHLSPATTRTKSVRLHQVWRPASVDEGEDRLPDRGRGQDIRDTSRATMVARDGEEDVADESSAATRITLRPHDPRTGEEIEKREVVKGYEYNRGQFVTFTAEELKALDVESSKVIDLEKFLPRNDIDPVYFDSPYYVYPDDPIAVETLQVIGAAMAEAGVAGLGRLTLSRRERMVMIEPRGTGMALFTLRAAAEVRASQFGSANGDLDAEMVAIAGAIIRQRTGKFDPRTFRDSYQEALQQLIEAKMQGLAIKPTALSTPPPVIDLMAALKRSLAEEAMTQKRSAASPERRNRAASDRRQAALLLPLSGGSKGNGERSAGPAAIGTRRRRKA
jgi:DNA end-binding protein Ku